MKVDDIRILEVDGTPVARLYHADKRHTDAKLSLGALANMVSDGAELLRNAMQRHIKSEAAP